MAKGKNNSSRGSNGWKGFVEVALPKSVGEDEIRAAAGNVDAVSAIEELVLGGYKVSVSSRGEGEAFICSITGKAGSGKNEGYTLSTWASAIDLAVLATWYKASVICEWGEWVADSKPFWLEV